MKVGDFILKMLKNQKVKVLCIIFLLISILRIYALDFNLSTTNSFNIKTKHSVTEITANLNDEINNYAISYKYSYNKIFTLKMKAGNLSYTGLFSRLKTPAGTAAELTALSKKTELNPVLKANLSKQIYKNENSIRKSLFISTSIFNSIMLYTAIYDENDFIGAIEYSKTISKLNLKTSFLFYENSKEINIFFALPFFRLTNITGISDNGYSTDTWDNLIISFTLWQLTAQISYFRGIDGLLCANGKILHTPEKIFSNIRYDFFNIPIQVGISVGESQHKYKVSKKLETSIRLKTEKNSLTFKLKDSIYYSEIINFYVSAKHKFYLLNCNSIYSNFSYSINKKSHNKNIGSTIKINNDNIFFNSLSFSYKTSFYNQAAKEKKKQASSISSNLTFQYGKNISVKGTISLKVGF